MQLVGIINRKRNFSDLTFGFFLEPERQELSQEMNMEISALTETPYGFEYNDSFYDYDEVLCDYGSEAEYGQVAIHIILSIVIVLSFIGNILVVVISVFCMRLRSLTNIFILNLALSDLLFTVGLVHFVSEHFWGWTFGDAACNVAIFLCSAGFYSSLALLELMSVQHYIATVHPLSGWKKGRCFTLVLIIAWLGSFLAAVPAAVHSRHIFDPESHVFYCTYSSSTVWVTVQYEENFVFVFAFIVMAFCYIRILQTIIKSPRTHRHRATGLSFLLVATYFVFWAPYNILHFLHNLIYHEVKFVTQCEGFHLDFASYICQLLAFTRCGLNPVIYGVSGVKFRKTVREVYQRRANLNLAQVSMVDQHSGSCVSLNNQVTELDVNHDSQEH